MLALDGERLDVEAGEGRLSLVATGPITIDVRYDLRAAAGGSEVEASVAISRAVGRLGRQFEPALAA